MFSQSSWELWHKTKHFQEPGSGGQVISPVSPVTSDISQPRQGGAEARKLAACIHSNVLWNCTKDKSRVNWDFPRLIWNLFLIFWWFHLAQPNWWSFPKFENKENHLSRFCVLFTKSPSCSPSRWWHYSDKHKHPSLNFVIKTFHSNRSRSWLSQWLDWNITEGLMRHFRADGFCDHSSGD